MQRGILRVAALLLLTNSMALAPACAESFSDIFVFGDSFSDSGNAFAATRGFIPSDPPYFQGRFSNGPVWAERLAEFLGLTLVANGADPAAVLGNNFAVAASQARVDVPVFPLGIIPSITSQAEFFATALKTVPADALYVLFTAHDDLRVTVQPDEGLDPESQNQRVTESIEAILTAVERLANAGGATFLVPNALDLGRTPEARVLGNTAELTALVSTYNEALRTALLEQEATLGVRIVQADVFTFGEAIVADALTNQGQVYGITNIDVPILEGAAGSPGAPPATSAFFDDLHPSAVFHNLLGEFAFVALQSTPKGVEGHQLPGDCNQDGDLDISDGICTLGVLFLGDPVAFPCGDGTSGDPANLALGDFNGDGRLDVSDGVATFGFLFGGDDSPHPLGGACVAIPGCPERCES